MTNKMSYTEDDIIKKRLLIEGDSGNEDRLISKLIKNFVKWTNSSFNTNQSEQANEDENSDYLHEQMMASFSHAEFGLLRNQFILDMNKMEQDNYEVLYNKINTEIDRAKKKIIESKKDLQEARKIRKNRQEYDILARQILNYSNRTEMQSKIKMLEDKVESLKKQESEYEKKIDLRRKQFSVVLQSLSTMKNLIETDLKLDDYLNTASQLNNEDQPAQQQQQQLVIESSENQQQESATKSLTIDAIVPIKKSITNEEDMDDDSNNLNGNNGSSSHNKHDKNYTNNEIEMEEY